MEKPKKPNPLADLMARDIVGEQLSALKQKRQPNAANSADKSYSLSPATLKALARFGPGNPSNTVPTVKPPPLPLPATDWELWAYMPKATLTETVAVSLGIDPSATKPGSGYVEPGKEYDRRLKIACAYVSHAGPLKSLDALPPMHMLYGPATATVSLPQFAEWALSMGWTLPEKFPRWKAAPVKTVTQTPAPAQSPAPPAPVVTDKPAPVNEKPWLVADPKDPIAEQPWYTPARYFARQLVLKDSTLLTKKQVLADKVSLSLYGVGIYKRGGKKRHAAETVLKAFSNVALG